MADLHDRMPVVLDASSWDRWLTDGRTGPPVDPGELLAMLEPSDAVPLRVYPVNRYVNDVRRDGPELIEPLTTVAAPRPRARSGSRPQSTRPAAMMTASTPVLRITLIVPLLR